MLVSCFDTSEVTTKTVYVDGAYYCSKPRKPDDKKIGLMVSKAQYARLRSHPKFPDSV